MHHISVATQRREQFVAITPQLQDLVTDNAWQKGALLVYCPHTTASLTINESADPDVQHDISGFMHSLVPQSHGFLHVEGNSDAHVKTSLFGPSCMLIVEGGIMQLGTWQSVYFCEWDGPRQREVWVQFLPS